MLFLGRIKQVSSSDTDCMPSFKSHTRTRYPYEHYRSPSHHLMWLTQEVPYPFSDPSKFTPLLLLFFQVRILHRALCPPPVKLTCVEVLLTVLSCSLHSASTLSSSRRLNLPGLDRLLQG